MTQGVHAVHTVMPSARTFRMLAESARTREREFRANACAARPHMSSDSASQFQRMSMWDEWPRQSFLELGSLPGAVPCARLHARQLLWEWKQSELSEVVELLVSELVTNAVKANRAMEHLLPVRFWLLSDNARIMIVVWDANPQPPMRVDPSDEAESGRGLVLVEALSKQWDWHVPPELGGKAVWALVAS